MSLEVMNGLHVVDENGEFGCKEEDFNAYFKASDSRIEGRDYSVVSILGCQSSGKSTLLNLLFGTCFEMMDRLKGRNQTTRGIWMGCATKIPGIVVMDLEGTDSGERGEDRGSLERQTGLFGLALAEVLIINMWYHDIGRYTAANLGILKTIFEVNLQLFNSGSKTQIFFLIRDHESDTPIESLEVKIRSEMARIWGDVKIPASLAHVTMSDMFDFVFHGLPHKIYETAAFEVAVDDLRLWFSQRDHPRYLFGGAAHRSKSVPVSGFGQYVHTIWTNVRAHRELNLPSQREMLATFRCDEYAHTALLAFRGRIEALLAAAKVSLLPDFGSSCREFINTAVASFQQAAEGYEVSVVRRKQDELVSKLVDELTGSWSAQIKFAIQESVQIVESAIRRDLPADADFSKKFHTLSKVWKESALSHFRQVVESCHVPEAVHWSTELDQKDLESKIHRQISVCRKENIVKLIESLKLENEVELQPKVSSLFNRSPDDQWQQIRAAFDIRKADIESMIGSSLADYEATQLELISLSQMLTGHARELIRSLQKNQAPHVPMKMKKRFDRVFGYDQANLPRAWSRKEKPRVIYEEARIQAIELLERFATFQLEEKHDAPVDEIISEAERREFELQFREDSQHALREAEWKQNKSNEANVPWWVFVVILVLGWNELLYIATNPLLLLLLLGTLAYWAYVNLEALEDMDTGPFAVFVPVVIKLLKGRSHAHTSAVSSAASASTSAASPTDAQAPGLMRASTLLKPAVDAQTVPPSLTRASSAL